MSADLEFIRALPKAELHVHLEGTVTPQTLRALAARHGVNLDAPTCFGELPPIPPPPGTSEGAPLLRDFTDFIGLYLKISDCLRTAGDLELLADAYAASCAEQRILYSEIYFTPSTFVTLGRDLNELFEGLLRAEEVARRHGTQFTWIFDIVRNIPGDGWDTLEHCLTARKGGLSVRALGLAGYEALGPAAQFAPVFAAAREHGFITLAHAGETSGAESVRETLRHLRPTRIGHGIRALEDREVVNELVAAGTVVEVSPWSNIGLQITDEKNHPVALMIELGLNVVLAADDPGIFGKDLVANYCYAASRGVDAEALQRCAALSLSCRPSSPRA